MDKEEASVKRSVKTLLLLLVLCVAVGGYWLAMHISQDEDSVTQSEGTFALGDHENDEITSLQWTASDVDYHFVKAEAIWQVEGNEAFPLDSDAVQAMADSLAALTATRKLTDVSTLGDYGLDEPAFTVSAAWSDGSTATYAMGDATPFADGYYLYLTDDTTTVYTVASSLSSMFNKTMNTLAVKETIPTAENVNRLTVGDTLDVTYLEESTTFDPDQHWYDMLTGAALDGSSVESLITTAQGLTWLTLFDEDATAEELDEYHLTEETATVITLYDGDEAATTLLIGAATDSSAYYARLPGSKLVYTISATNVDTLLNASADDMAPSDLMPLTYENLYEAVFTAGDVSYTLIPPLKEEADEGEADEETDEEAESPDEDPGEELWAQVLALTAQEAEQAVDGDEILTIQVVSTNGGTATMTFASYTVDDYQVSVDGGKARLVSADSVDKLIRMVKALQ